MRGLGTINAHFEEDFKTVRPSAIVSQQSADIPPGGESHQALDEWAPDEVYCAIPLSVVEAA